MLMSGQSTDKVTLKLVFVTDKPSDSEHITVGYAMLVHFDGQCLA